jgi:hypothetical protein
MNDQTIQALREAVKVSPDNVPLRQHLADSLLTLGRFAEAEQEYRQAMALAAGNVTLRLGLARAYCQQNKNSQALVIIEDLLKQACYCVFTSTTGCRPVSTRACARPPCGSSRASAARWSRLPKHCAGACTVDSALRPASSTSE